jgi:putative sporulation protein YyaC
MAAPSEVRIDDPAGLVTLSGILERELGLLGGSARPVAFACIGTDRSTGDALGPLVGQRLLKLGYDPAGVIGTLEEPLHALNLEERLLPVTRGGEGRRPLVVAVDAALGSISNVGTVNVRRGGLLPGQGVGKSLPRIGELAVTATVNVQAGALDVQVLQSTRLYLVQQLAELIGVSCWWAHRNLRRPAAGTAAGAPRVVAA